MTTSIYENLPAWATRIPFIAGEIEKSKQQRDDTRAGKNRQIADLQAKLAKELPALQKTEGEALARCQAAEKALLELQHSYRKAMQARVHFANSTQGQIDRLACELRSDVSELVEIFRLELLDLHDAERRKGYESIQGLDTTGRQDVPVGTTNSEAVAARLRRISEIVASEIPRLQLLPHAEMPAAMQALRESIPTAACKWNDPALAAKLEAGPSKDWFDFRRIMAAK